MISWKQLQRWINRKGYRLDITKSGHAMLYLTGEYTVFLGPHNSSDGIKPSKLKEIADCLGIDKNDLIGQIEDC